MSMASRRYSRIIGRSWCSVSALNTSACDRTAGGTLRIEQGLDSRAAPLERLPLPSGSRRPRTFGGTRAASSSGGVSRTASAASTAAASGAPRAAAASAARSTTSASRSSGLDVASARWRASCSRSSTRPAASRCRACRRPDGMPKYTAAPSSGCVKRTTPSLPTAIAPARDGVVQQRLGVGVPERLRQQGRRRALDRRNKLEQRQRFVRKSLDPVADEFLERGRHR